MDDIDVLSLVGAPPGPFFLPAIRSLVHNTDVRNLDITYISVTVAEYQAILSTREDEFTERI